MFLSIIFVLLHNGVNLKILKFSLPAGRQGLVSLKTPQKVSTSTSFVIQGMLHLKSGGLGRKKAVVNSPIVLFCFYGIISPEAIP